MGFNSAFKGLNYKTGAQNKSGGQISYRNNLLSVMLSIHIPAPHQQGQINKKLRFQYSQQ